MALVTWGGGRLRIETHKGSRGQITQEEPSEMQGQSVEGAGSACAPPPSATSGFCSHQGIYLLTLGLASIHIMPVCLSFLASAVGEHSPAVVVGELGKCSLRTLPCESVQTSTSGAKSPPTAVTPNHQMGKVRPQEAKQRLPTPQAGQVHLRLWLLTAVACLPNT